MTQQGTLQWFTDRAGCVTASRFGTVLYGTARSKNQYLRELRNPDPLSDSLRYMGEACAFGHAKEDEARTQYELLTGEKVTQVGFVRHWTMPRVGCSPDGLIAPNGGLEIKCKLSPTEGKKHRRELPPEYHAQVHGAIWICEADWWDVVIYEPNNPDPTLRLQRTRVHRFEDHIKRLEKAVVEFVQVLESGAQFYEPDFSLSDCVEDVL